MNRYVGTAKAVPDSRTPRRFIAVSATTISDRDQRLVPRRNANAVAAFCTPDGDRDRDGQDVVDEQGAAPR